MIFLVSKSGFLKISSQISPVWFLAVGMLNLQSLNQNVIYLLFVDLFSNSSVDNNKS